MIFKHKSKNHIILVHKDNACSKVMLGSTYLHGHLHSYKDYNQEQRSNRMLRYDALVDANNYYPVLLDDILDFFKDINPSEYDYHANSGTID